MIDLAVLRETTGGQEDLAKELIELFAEERPVLVERIRTAIAHRDPVDLVIAAHTLKASLLVFGARAGADLALSLEVAGREQELEGTAETLAALEQALDGIRQALDGVLAELGRE